MWVIPTRVNPIPDLSRYLDAFRMSCQRAGKVVCVTGVVPMAAMKFE
jgi:hypothetical protein